MYRFVLLFVICLGLTFSGRVQADTFGSGSNTFDIDFVTIGDPGNVADTTGDPNPAGAVAYEYRIGKYEISEQMINKANAQSTLEGDPLGITVDARGPDKPATRASWFEAAKFVNWLNTSTGNTPAYKFDDQGDFQLWEVNDPGYDSNNLFRNSEAKYFLPSADEWYKAAFYDPVSDQWFDFPNGMDTPPLPVEGGTDPNTAIYNQAGPADVMLAGGESPFGTVGQAGNVWEWEETESDLANDDPVATRGFRGSSWLSIVSNESLSSSSRGAFIQLPQNGIGDTGFRVGSSVPEPCCLVLFIAGACAILSCRRLT